MKKSGGILLEFLTNPRKVAKFSWVSLRESAKPRAWGGELPSFGRILLPFGATPSLEFRRKQKTWPIFSTFADSLRETLKSLELVGFSLLDFWGVKFSLELLRFSPLGVVPIASTKRDRFTEREASKF